MDPRIEKIKAKATELADKADPVAAKVRMRKGVREYNAWFSAALAFVEANMRSRLPELKSLHGGMLTYLTSSGLGHCDGARDTVIQMKGLVASVPDYIEASLHNLELAVADTLMGDLLREAETLLKAKYVRAAGALAGVMLERHLKMLCDRQEPPIKYPDKATISKLNDPLRDSGVYDQAAWRRVQWMADVRNTCDHAKTDEPKPQDVADLIAEVRKFIALNTI